MLIEELSKPLEFEWDHGNLEKNVLKHKVTNEECEQAVLNNKSILFDDIIHSFNEGRYNIIGSSNAGRMLFIAFTIRNNRVRVISARNADKKERNLYEEASKIA